MANKILLTGSCGFVFSNIFWYLLQHTDYDIVSVDKLTYAGNRRNISENDKHKLQRHKFYLGDICDQHFINKVFEIEKPDIVVNGCAESHVDNSLVDSSAFIKTNILGTCSMLEASLKVHTPKKFIMFNTDEVYGEIESGAFKETDILNPRNPYSGTKASADQMTIAYHNSYKLPTIITRCCNIFGPRQNMEKLIPKTIFNVLNNKKIGVYGRGAQKREWIYVKDVFWALMDIIERGKVGEIYNIGSDFEIQNIELVKLIIKILGRNDDMIEFVRDRIGHDQRYFLDTTKIRTELGWVPKYKFEDALEYTVKWYKKNNWVWKK